MSAFVMRKCKIKVRESVDALSSTASPYSIDLFGALATKKARSPWTITKKVELALMNRLGNTAKAPSISVGKADTCSSFNTGRTFLCSVINCSKSSCLMLHVWVQDQELNLSRR